MTKNSLKIVLVSLAAYLVFGGVTALAQESYKLQVPLVIVGEGGKIETITKIPSVDQKGPSISRYIRNLYLWSLGIGGLLAMFNIVLGGILYTLSAGNIAKREDARSRITQAIIGLTLLFGAYLILRTINPDLVKLGKLEQEINVLGLIERKARFGSYQQQIDALNKQITLLDRDLTKADVKENEASAKLQASRDELTKLRDYAQGATRLTPEQEKALRDKEEETLQAEISWIKSEINRLTAAIETEKANYDKAELELKKAQEESLPDDELRSYWNTFRTVGENLHNLTLQKNEAVENLKQALNKLVEFQKKTTDMNFKPQF